jgi:hypothetical protein
VSLATLGLGESVLPFAVLAAVMVGFQLALVLLFLPRRTDPTRPRLSRAILVAYLLPSSALMWLVLPGAVLRPSYDSWWAAIQAMMVPMPAPFLWFMSQVFRAEERPIDRHTALWPALLAGAVIVNEALMGYAFAALAGAPGLDDPATALALSFNSPWFAGSMIATMGGLLAWVPMAGWRRIALGGIALSAIAGPLWLIDPVLCAAALGIAMALTLLAVVAGLARPTIAGSEVGAFAWGIGGAAAAMTLAGALSTLLPGFGSDGLPFAVVSGVVMLVETAYLVHAGLVSTRDLAPAVLAPQGPVPAVA